MNLATVTNKLSTFGGPRVQLAAAKVGKYSPQILTAVGLVGGVAATVMIAKATLKLEPIMDNHDMGKEAIRIRESEGFYADQKEHDKDVRKLYIGSGLEIAKAYGPGVSIYAASALCVIAAQGISHKRQVATVAALKSVESMASAYRQRVIEAIGADKESDIYYGVTTETVEDENGKKSKVKDVSLDSAHEYISVFDEMNPNYQRGMRELNLLFLKNHQNWANDRLNSRGYIYLNEVRGYLGLPQTPAGQVLGWLHKDFKNGDGYVDFGVDNPVNGQVKRFLEGDEEGILLSFNCDGEIVSRL